MEKTTTYITDYNCVTPLGFNVADNWQNVQDGKSGIRKHDLFESQPPFHAGIIDNNELERIFSAEFESENFTRLEKMLLLSLKPLIEKNGVKEKTGFILSTTKGNVSSLKDKDTPPEEAYLSVLAKTIADVCGFKTKPVVISNACVSGVMAVSVAKNMIESGLYEDVYVLAGDEVSEFVISGFNSFQAMSANPCKPYDENRDGITIGEAAAAVYVTSAAPTDSLYFEILGESAVNDANHISGPSRTGEGLFRSIKNALKEAKISADQISYLSAHGTATVYNDEMESIAFTRAGLQHTPVNSLKGFYGHCLGASGLLEIIIAMESARNNMLISSLNLENQGVSQALNIITENKVQEIEYILKTASGFGGSNAAIILKKCAQ
ncbi:beta-ketoacyl synthase [Chryseobacterium sp. cx-311]|uniref:beta-ketoacyl synthase N-terminal-like domain-containing protein n=1 Tax=Marnyiella aurantia TaxID=2758037 RepID=UPI001AE717D4|nr:beta-ketoacyl synthase N-terminal-like domain-containing protein [Marnyiella aurantia]MBP0613123.1 beta-ketoacyl synthase [Marnyiella aurantia]